MSKSGTSDCGQFIQLEADNASGWFRLSEIIEIPHDFIQSQVVMDKDSDRFGVIKSLDPEFAEGFGAVLSFLDDEAPQEKQVSLQRVLKVRPDNKIIPLVNDKSLIARNSKKGVERKNRFVFQSFILDRDKIGESQFISIPRGTNLIGVWVERTINPPQEIIHVSGFSDREQPIVKREMLIISTLRVASISEVGLLHLIGHTNISVSNFMQDELFIFTKWPERDWSPEFQGVESHV
ncbi:hypothetical protein EHO57_14210 [Leptospira langatensis]|uniref:Uncharacterized protein n=1 Tax=Leptospira langatensis TaxID=2484983 RepID=A0A5R2ASX2_9LEPT|nr:hypothetical protein [Leptospira langatensis]TGJ99908.1 hypothetical protein EHO57_14210 [Leptospira langatensis]